MGCDIHITAERKTDSGYEPVDNVEFSEGTAPFNWRSYGLYGFLADVRNYSECPPISSCRGLPDDISPYVENEYRAWDLDAHSPSWLSTAELIAFDYDKRFEDRRVSKQIGTNLWSGASTAERRGGGVVSYRDFLGLQFFSDLATLKECGAERIVFWFDN